MISYFRTKYLISHLIMVLITLVLPCPSTANTMNGSMDFDKTVAVVTDTSPEDGSTEMIILTKEGTSYSLSDGTWDLNQLDAPGPHWFRGYAVATSGTYILNGIDSENTPFNGTGTISIAADGSVSITTPGSPFQCHLDSGKTVMACTATQADDSSSLLVMTRRGTSSSFADLAFTWYLNVLSSPGPSWMRGTIIVDTLGNFVMSGTDYQGNTQGASGTTSINAPDGIISFTQTLPSPKQPFPCTLDAGKTVMACTKSSNAGASSDLLIMTKRAPSYLSGDLTGVWHSHSLATGASQWWSSGVLTFLTGGFFNGSGTGYGGGTWDTSGVASISTSGLVIHTDDFTASTLR